jgi:hypothetical protein
MLADFPVSLTGPATLGGLGAVPLDGFAGRIVVVGKVHPRGAAALEPKILTPIALVKSALIGQNR